VSDVDVGREPPEIRLPRPGTNGASLLERAAQFKAPMGPRQSGPANGLVYARARGANVWDVDGNRYVDLCAGFGAVLLGHGHPTVTEALQRQASELVLALGDVFDSVAKVRLLERLANLFPIGDSQVILGSSGADAVSAALKTCVLRTGRPGVVAFEGCYHGLSYGPLAALGLRESYRAPFQAQLNPHVEWLPFPDDEAALKALEYALDIHPVGAVLLEPVLGRGGVRPLGPAQLARIAALAREHGALLVADEVWTGLGRSGSLAWSTAHGVLPDLLCLGKGLGGGLPMSACVGSRELLSCWSREAEVVHTSTHAGNPLAAACALATLDAIEEEALVLRSREVGERFAAELEQRLSGLPVAVRAAGLMIGVELLGKPTAAIAVMQQLLDDGYIVSTGGGRRDTVILTPPLTIATEQLEGFLAVAPVAFGRALSA
jgi:4-aminobutyrate aminotransferase/(S)-3-amino-2-methylpropionate transaminase